MPPHARRLACTATAAAAARAVWAALHVLTVAAAADIHYCFGMKGEPVDSLVAGNRARMEEMLISGFCGRGDLLIVIQNATDSDSAVDLSEPGLVVVGRLVDMIEKGEC